MSFPSSILASDTLFSFALATIVSTDLARTYIGISHTFGRLLFQHSSHIFIFLLLQPLGSCRPFQPLEAILSRKGPEISQTEVVR
jgi:hypothetical protein